MSKTNWLETTVVVDEWGREPSLSDVPMHFMKRRVAFEKRGYTPNKIDELYSKALKQQKEFDNG